MRNDARQQKKKQTKTSKCTQFICLDSICFSFVTDGNVINHLHAIEWNVKPVVVIRNTLWQISSRKKAIRKTDATQIIIDVSIVRVA